MVKAHFITIFILTLLTLVNDKRISHSFQTLLPRIVHLFCCSFYKFYYFISFLLHFVVEHINRKAKTAIVPQFQNFIAPILIFKVLQLLLADHLAPNQFKQLWPMINTKTLHLLMGAFVEYAHCQTLQSTAAAEECFPLLHYQV